MVTQEQSYVLVVFFVYMGLEVFIVEVRITCKADSFLPLDKIKDFQGELKTRTISDIEHLISSIERHGFAFPFFIWKQPDGTCSCLDGHGRIMALTQMKKEGYEIPELPVVYIEAENENEARTKLIQINTVTGRFTEGGFRDLVKDIPDLDLSQYTYPDLDLKRIEQEMEVLQRAKENIESDSSWKSEFANVGYMDEEVAKKAKAGYENGGGVTASVSGNSVPSHTQSNIANNGENETQEVIGVSATQYGQEDTPKEIVVYCPDCGEEFVVTYNGGENE